MYVTAKIKISWQYLFLGMFIWEQKRFSDIYDAIQIKLGKHYKHFELLQSLAFLMLFLKGVYFYFIAWHKTNDIKQGLLLVTIFFHNLCAGSKINIIYYILLWTKLTDPKNLCNVSSFEFIVHIMMMTNSFVVKRNEDARNAPEMHLCHRHQESAGLSTV